MSIENKPEKVTLERHAWRAAGLAIGLESLRLLATNGLRAPTNRVEAYEYLALGLIIPAWAIWSEGEDALRAGLGLPYDPKKFKGWLGKDISSVASSLKETLKLKK